ncbi:MAG: MarR family transcriptional regulator [Pseudomonadota bacterium]
MKNHLDDHPLAAAFLANRLDRLADLIVTQGETLLSDVGVQLPARAVSTILLIGESGTASTADIAEKLGQPHQVATQRVELLIAEGVITRTPDPRDGRRKLLMLTALGKAQHQTLERRLRTACEVFEALCREVDCDLPLVLDRMAAALGNRSLTERARAIEERQSKQAAVGAS